MTRKINSIKRKKQANEIHNNKYDYSLWPENVKIKDKVIIICPEHGQFIQMLEKHIHSKTGCPKCKHEKKRQTMLKRYGVEFSGQSKTISEKRKTTCLKKYGVENPIQNKKIHQKILNTNIQRYGVEYPTQNSSILEKLKQTNQQRRNVDFPAQHQDVINTRKSNNFDKHGVEHVCQTHISPSTLNKMNDKEWLIEQHHVLEKPLKEISKNLGDISTTATLNQRFYDHHIEIKHFFRSVGEREVENLFTNTLKFQCVSNVRNIIPPYELDLYIPSLNLAIEYNGDYWHGVNFPNQQRRDATKISMCIENDINLLVILESDWLNNRNAVIQQIIDIVFLNLHC